MAHSVQTDVVVETNLRNLQTRLTELETEEANERPGEKNFSLCGPKHKIEIVKKDIEVKRKMQKFTKAKTSNGPRYCLQATRFRAGKIHYAPKLLEQYKGRNL